MPFTPASISGLVEWHDPTDPATITSSGGAVSQHDDKSGNAYHQVQATGSLQPATGLRTINSLNAFAWNESGSADNMLGGAFASGLSMPWTVAGVIQYDATGMSNSQWMGNYTNTGALFQTSGAYGLYAGVAISGGTVDTGAHIWVGLFISGAAELYIDDMDTPIASGNAGIGVTLPRLQLGSDSGTFPFDGLSGDIAVWNRAITAGERGSLKDLWKPKWGTP